MKPLETVITRLTNTNILKYQINITKRYDILSETLAEDAHNEIVCKIQYDIEMLEMKSK